MLYKGCNYIEQVSNAKDNIIRGACLYIGHV